MKKALLTGGSSGIGAALASLLAKQGYQLLLTGRDAFRLQQVAASVQGKYLVADLATEKGREAVCGWIGEEVPNLIVNNAGYGRYGEAIFSSVSQQVEILEVNGRAALEVTLTAAQALYRAQKTGTILHVSSAAGEFPTPGMSVYGASKAFMTHFAEGLATELSPYGIRVLVACPGMVATPFSARAAGKEKESITEAGGDILSPEFVAEEIWRQISKGEEKRVIGWRYRMALLLARCFPRSYVKRIIWRRIQEK